MASVSSVKKAESRKPYQTLRMGRSIIALRQQAVRDARAPLPVLLDENSPPGPTPYVQELDRQRLEVIAYERGKLVSATSQLCMQYRLNAERIRQAEIALLAASTDTHWAGAPSATDCQLRLAGLRSSQAALREQIARQCSEAQHRALRFDEFMRRCCARYARTLIRCHPAGAALAELGWPSLGPLPAWVLASDPTAALKPTSDD